MRQSIFTVTSMNPEAARLRREKRGVPYLFLKPSRGAVVGNGAPIVIPYGRNRTDWEVELGAVIGRTAKYVSADDAEDYVFGYVVTLDISDRGGRPPGGSPFRTDWFVGKGHDTFAPQGPWIVPKEFYGNPMEILRQTLSIGDEQMQEATAGDMIHSLWELIEFGSSVITLYPGDVINKLAQRCVVSNASCNRVMKLLQRLMVLEHCACRWSLRRNLQVLLVRICRRWILTGILRSWERHVYMDVLISRGELFLAEFSRLENSPTIETDARERRRPHKSF